MVRKCSYCFSIYFDIGTINARPGLEASSTHIALFSHYGTLIARDLTIFDRLNESKLYPFVSTNPSPLQRAKSHWCWDQGTAQGAPSSRRFRLGASTDLPVSAPGFAEKTLGTSLAPGRQPECWDTPGAGRVVGSGDMFH
jgi:hypothetical protein